MSLDPRYTARAAAIANGKRLAEIAALEARKAELADRRLFDAETGDRAVRALEAGRRLPDLGDDYDDLAIGDELTDAQMCARGEHAGRGFVCTHCGVNFAD